MRCWHEHTSVESRQLGFAEIVCDAGTIFSKTSGFKYMLLFAILMRFLTEFIKDPKSIGAIAPSSKGLAELITAELDGSQVIVELGPGTGSFTELICSKKRSDSRFLAIEYKDVFAEQIRERFSGVEVYKDSAVNISKYLRGAKAGCIVSGLPWAIFNDEQQNELLAAIYDSLAPNGTFSTFAYVHGLILPAGINFRRKLNEKFHDVKKSRIVWKNLPPAFVYVARK